MKKDSVDISLDLDECDQESRLEKIPTNIVKITVQDQIQKSNPRKKRRNSVIIKQNLPSNQVEDDTVYCFCRLGSFGDMVGCDAAVGGFIFDIYRIVRLNGSIILV